MICTQLGSRLYEMGIYAKEVGESFERAGQWRYTRQRLDFILRDQLVLHRRQPEEIE
jgi:hypothetical protein